MQKLEKVIVLSVLILLVIYVALRAAFVPLIHDEIATFFRYVQIGKFIPFYSEWDANNHPLNSAVTALFFHLSGDSPLSLRMGSVLAFVLYCYYIYRFSVRFSTRALRIIFPLVMCMCHGFIEFFGFSRGYGLSMTFLVGSIWHLTEFFKDQAPKQLFLGVFFSTLMFTANLTMLNSALAIDFLFILILLASKSATKTKRFLNLTFLAIFGIAPISVLSVYLFRLKERGLLYKGGMESFLHETLESLIVILNGKASGIILATSIVIFGVLIVRCVWIHTKASSFTQKTEGHMFCYLLFANIAGIFLLRYIFRVNFPEDRAALYLFPLFAASVIFGADRPGSRAWKIITMACALLLLYFPLQFLYRINLSYATIENQEIPQRFYEQVRQVNKSSGKFHTIGGYKSHELRWTYMSYRDDGNMGKMQSVIFPSYAEDYQVAHPGRYPGWRDLYDSIDFYRVSGIYLLKRKHPAKEILIKKFDDVRTDGTTETLFFPLIPESTMDTSVTIFRFRFDLEISCEARPFQAYIVSEMCDKENNVVSYATYGINWFYYDLRNENSRVMNDLMARAPASAAFMKLYIWNIGRNSFRIKNGTIHIYSVDERS